MKTIEMIEDEIESMIHAVYDEAGLKWELDAITTYHWVPYTWDSWEERISKDDLSDHLHVFGEYCHWRCGGFDGFVDDFGWFRYLPGNC